MELAIPFIALGGMYVLSNQSASSNQSCSSSKKQENFESMGTPNNYLPNTNIPPQNYPTVNISQLKDTVQEYINPNAATDKYFDQNLYEQRVNQNQQVGQNPQQIYSLTGDYLNSTQFKHNNMVPFYGAKIKGKTYDMNIAESVLDNMAGTGSQTIKKIEQAPLFKPEENMQWAYGAPNNSDFYQSRVNPGMKNNNVKPFDTLMVGPGLDKGYGVNGSGGYNSGMEARDQWLPKTVDELRVATNPKLEYQQLGHEGPANSFIKAPASAQQQGRVEKQRPDTFYIQTQDRWFTTTGAEKGQTLQPIQEMGIIRRNDIVTDYAGPAIADKKMGPAPENFEPSKRTQLAALHVGHSNATNTGDHQDKDRFQQSHTNYTNHRSTLKQPESFGSGFSAAIGAVVAPLMDVLRPSRKEEFTANVRIYGEAGSTVPSSYVINPYDTTPTTNKETTLYSPSFNIDNQKDGIYVNNYTTPDLTQRDTTSCSQVGPAGGHSTQYGDMWYDAAYRQHNNDIKSATIDNRMNQGGTQIFNQQMNVNCFRQDCNRYDGRMGAPALINPLPASTQNYGKITFPQKYDENANCERIQPDILNAFRSNPYTHPLTTSV